MKRQITNHRLLCSLTGLWYDEVRYFLNDEEVSEREFRASFR